MNDKGKLTLAEIVAAKSELSDAITELLNEFQENYVGISGLEVVDGVDKDGRETRALRVNLNLDAVLVILER